MKSRKKTPDIKTPKFLTYLGAFAMAIGGSIILYRNLDWQIFAGILLVSFSTMFFMIAEK